MRITEMSPQESRALLARLGYGRLACARENQPYIVPIDFTYEEDCLYCFSTLGRKIEWMRTNPQVCLQADEIRGRYTWQSVIVQGRYEELSENAGRWQTLTHAMKLLSQRSLWWQAAYAAHQLRGPESDPSPVVFCVHIAEMTGHRAEPDPADLAATPSQSKE